jgi:hypothetical protein
MDLEQHPGVAGAEQSAPNDIEVQAMGAGVSNRDDALDADRIAGFNDDLRRVRDVDVKRIRNGIVDGPPCSAGHGDVDDPLPRANIHDRHRRRTGDGRVAHMSDQESTAPWIVCETIRPNADFDPVDRGTIVWAEPCDRILPSVRRDDEIRPGRDERARDRCQVPDGADVLLRGDIDDVHRVVRGVGHVNPTRGIVDGGMVEAPGLRMRGQCDEPPMPKRHVSVPPRAPRPGAPRAPRCGPVRPHTRD